MSSSDSDESGSKQTKNNASTSSSDFENRNNIEKTKTSSTPNISFQQMLINANNKFNEMMKSKCKSAGVQFRETPKSKSNLYEDFTPTASSTHVGNILHQTTSHKKTNSRNEPSDNDKEIIQYRKKLKFDHDIKKRKRTQSISELENRKRSWKNDDNSSNDDRMMWNKIAPEKFKNSGASEVKLKQKNQNIIANSIKREIISNSEDEEFRPVNKKAVNINNESKLPKIEEYEDSSSLFSSDDETKQLIKNKNKPIDINDYTENFLRGQSYSSRTDEDTTITSKNSDQTNHKKKKKAKRNSITEEHIKSNQVQASCSSNFHDNKNSGAQLQLETFRKKHKLTKIENKDDFLENLKSKHELYIIQIPKRLDPNKLIGTRISLEENVRVPEKSKKYDCIPSTSPQLIPIFCNNENISLIKCAGNLKIQKHLKTRHASDRLIKNDDDISLPNNLKQRHPLFGANYEDKINLEDHIKEKLQAAIESYSEKKKKKKQKRAKETPEKEEEIFKILTQADPIVDKKLKKEKSVLQESDYDTDIPIKKKRKKSKRSSEREPKRELDEASTSGKNADDSVSLIDGLLSKSLEIFSTKKKNSKRKISTA